uniref:Uncharacterized protein n=1 Tax=Solanum lycopersicum TaxID=4081 RepID=A0A3Q7G1Y4_SOLLC
MLMILIHLHHHLLQQKLNCLLKLLMLLQLNLSSKEPDEEAADDNNTDPSLPPPPLPAAQLSAQAPNAFTTQLSAQEAIVEEADDDDNTDAHPPPPPPSAAQLSAQVSNVVTTQLSAQSRNTVTMNEFASVIFANPNLDSDSNVPPDKIDRAYHAGKARRKGDCSSVNPVQEGVSKAPAADTKKLLMKKLLLLMIMIHPLHQQHKLEYCYSRLQQENNYCNEPNNAGSAIEEVIAEEADEAADEEANIADDTNPCPPPPPPPAVQ